MKKKIISIGLLITLLFNSCTYEKTTLENNTKENKIETSTIEDISEKISETTENLSIEETTFAEENTLSDEEYTSVEKLSNEEEAKKFYSLSDPKLLQYIEDQVYASIESSFDGEDYRIEGIDAIYISKEYIEELNYNSKENIYFGYTLAELDAQYEGERYVFTVDDTGNTIVKSFEKYDDTYSKLIQNVAIGTGVILVAVTVSVLATPIGLPQCVSMVFAASAKTGTAFALSSAGLGFASTAIVKGIETKDFEETLKEATYAGSEGFKWGAISGVVAGGAAKSLSLFRSARKIPTHRQSELDVLKRIKGGREQVSYFNGEEVSSSMAGATRPDIVVDNLDGTIKAVEVKNYDLNNRYTRNSMYNTLKRQVAERSKNLPKGSTQEVVLDTRGRKYSKELIKEVTEEIKRYCSEFYPDIPVTIFAY